MTINVGLIGDYSPKVAAHIAIPKALQLAAVEVHKEVNTVWLGTEEIAENLFDLSSFDALWCVPASPYKNMNGALMAIRYAREQEIPFLGTCGGFQHALIEYVRNVLGFKAADHLESNPQSEMPLIAPLACSMIEADGAIELKAHSRISRIYNCQEIVEQYHCSYGFNPRFKSLIEQSEMEITGFDASGDPRVIELKSHPFFISTLFQPERSALFNLSGAHPLIVSYLEAAALSQ